MQNSKMQKRNEKKIKFRLHFLKQCAIIAIAVEIQPRFYEYPGVAQLVARLTGGQEAVSSSLATRTKKERWTFVHLSFFVLDCKLLEASLPPGQALPASAVGGGNNQQSKGAAVEIRRAKARNANFGHRKR